MHLRLLKPARAKLFSLRYEDIPLDTGTSNVPRNIPRGSNLAELSTWRWNVMVAVIMLTSMINGYDVSNIANIQPQIYEALGHIELLSWIGLSYSISVFCMLPLAQKIMYCFNLRWTYIFSLVVFIVGACIAGAAHNIFSVIIGRVIMGIGGSIAQQGNMSFLAIFAPPTKMPTYVASISSIWAVGLIVGGPIGSAFAHGPSWRWALFFPAPCVGVALVMALLCMPEHKLIATTTPTAQKLLHIDPVGIFLTIAASFLFAVAVTFPNGVWGWYSTPSIIIWVVFVLVLVGWIAQQYFCILTQASERAIPARLLRRSELLPILLATACAGSTYAIVLYYTPLFYAFIRGLNAIDQTVKLLPFTIIFIFTVMVTGKAIRVLKRYSILFIAGGIIVATGSIIMAATLSRSSVSDSQIMALESLIGVGLGLHFQHGLAISNMINKTHEGDRVDCLLLCNMAQMGGICFTLAIAGSIYQNVGFKILSESIGHSIHSAHDIREALAGVSSPTSDNPVLLQRSLHAIATVISRQFFIPTSAGLLCFLCGLYMTKGK